MLSDEVLKLEEIRSRAGEIREEFEQLLSRPVFAPRPRAQQWLFFRHCLDVVLAGRSADFACDKTQAAQYRFEIEDRLTRYYAQQGKPLKYAFSLRHFLDAVREGKVNEEYSQANGYVLLVLDMRAAYLTSPEKETQELIQRVIADGNEAEFAVYRRLPVLDLSPLDGIFLKDGAAYTRILHVAERHHEKKWTISNPNNPSTRWLIGVKDVAVSGDEAQVRTEEYWYLKWWSFEKKKYVHIYNEQSVHRYKLVRQENRWLIEHDTYPQPRASAARRKWSS